MRVTNSMITRNSLTNINGNKVNVDKMNTQMSTQKKISRASEDPVIAIRSLRLRTTLSEINQYYEKNIPDAESWLEVTEGALGNLKDLLGDMYKECTHAANDTLNQNDRNAILKNLQALKDQIYHEMNTDEAGRTVFTGYKTNQSLTFTNDEVDTKYQITENFTFADIEEKNYYADNIKAPTCADEVNGVTTTIPTADNNLMTKEVTNTRIRLSYGQTDAGTNTMDSMSYSYANADGTTTKVAFKGTAAADGTMSYATSAEILTTAADGTVTSTAATAPAYTMKSMSYEDWQAADYVVGDNEAIYIPDTGEVMLGKNLKEEMTSDKASVSATYTKTGFEKGEIRPEMYFDCVDESNANSSNWITYTKADQKIEYTIAFNQTIDINTQADEVLDASVARDIDELTETVQAAIDAHKKYDDIKAMMSEEQYSDKTSQKNLAIWLEAAEKEATYADDNIQKVFGKGITQFETAQSKVILANTDVGSKGDRLKLTKSRMGTQQATFEELKSDNEDREISDIIVDYTSAYTAYQASLQAASKATETTLLNYI